MTNIESMQLSTLLGLRKPVLNFLVFGRQAFQKTSTHKIVIKNYEMDLLKKP